MTSRDWVSFTFCEIDSTLERDETRSEETRQNDLQTHSMGYIFCWLFFFLMPRELPLPTVVNYSRVFVVYRLNNLTDK